MNCGKSYAFACSPRPTTIVESEAACILKVGSNCTTPAGLVLMARTFGGLFGSVAHVLRTRNNNNSNNNNNKPSIIHGVLNHQLHALPRSRAKLT